MGYHDLLLAELKAGKVSEEGFKQLWDAECYGQAAFMTFLEKCLRTLEEIVKEGRQLEVYSTATHAMSILRTEPEFLDWCRQEFRDAYACFFDESRKRTT